jgi:hypothetical protein
MRTMPVSMTVTVSLTYILYSGFHSLFDPSYKAVSNSWMKATGQQHSDHFFAELDFPNGQAVYQKVHAFEKPGLIDEC